MYGGFAKQTLNATSRPSGDVDINTISILDVGRADHGTAKNVQRRRGMLRMSAYMQPLHI